MRVYLAACAKLENNYIREWLHHHIHMGIDKIILVDNNDVGTEKLSDVIQDYIDGGRVIVIEKFSTKFDQKEMYREIYTKYGSECDWIGFIDIDEFLVTENHKSMRDVLSNKIYDKFKYIKISWKTYTDSGLLKVENNNYSVKRFTEPYLDKNSMMNKRVKSFYRTKDESIAKSISVHNAYIDGKYCCNILGEIATGGTTTITSPIWKICWINHYCNKTIEEYVTNKVRKHVPNNRHDDSVYTKVYIKSLRDLSAFWEVNKKTPEKEKLAKKLLKELLG